MLELDQAESDGDKEQAVQKLVDGDEPQDEVLPRSDFLFPGHG